METTTNTTMPPKTSKFMKSTQLVYVDDKPQNFHKLDDDIVTQSPLFSKKKRESRMKRMSQMATTGTPRFTKRDTAGDENARDNQQVLPIISRKGSKDKKERKTKKVTLKELQEKKEEKREEKKEEKKEENEEKKVERGVSMNWAAMDDLPLRQTLPEKRRHARMRSLQPSHPDISSKFKFFYTSPDCELSHKMTEFCQQVPEPLESRSAEENPLKYSEAMTFVRKFRELLVIEKGGCEKIILNNQYDPPAALLEKKILDKQGNIKTPLSVIGYTVVLGFHEDIMRESLFFGNKSPSTFKRKRKGSISLPSKKTKKN